MQQAVETAGKAFLLARGVVTVKGVKEHNFEDLLKDYAQISKSDLKKLKGDFKANPDIFLKGTKKEIEFARSKFETEIGKNMAGMSLTQKEKESASKALATILTGFLFTQQHNQCTRYPGGILSPWDYTGTLGVVQMVPAFLSEVEILLGILKVELT